MAWHTQLGVPQVIRGGRDERCTGPSRRGGDPSAAPEADATATGSLRHPWTCSQRSRGGGCLLDIERTWQRHTVGGGGLLRSGVSAGQILEAQVRRQRDRSER